MVVREVSTPAFSDDPAQEQFTVTAVPVPDHLASADGDDTPAPPPPSPEQPRRRRILGGGGSTPNPGSRDTGPRANRKIAKEPREPKPLPRIPANGFAPGIEKMYLTVAMGVMPFDMQLSVVIAEIAPKAAQAWDELARRNEAVRRIIVTMMETTAVGAVIAAHMPLIAIMMMRVMKDDPRVSMIAEMLAREVNPENPTGNDSTA